MPDNLHFNQISLTDTYKKLKNQIQLELKEIQFVAVVIDSMIDFNQTCYLNFTCRFITSNWEMKSRTLQTLYIPKIFEQSSISVISKAVKKITDSWSITDKVAAIIKPHRVTIGKETFFRRPLLIVSVVTRTTFFRDYLN